MNQQDYQMLPTYSQQGKIIHYNQFWQPTFTHYHLLSMQVYNTQSSDNGNIFLYVSCRNCCVLHFEYTKIVSLFYTQKALKYDIVLRHTVLHFYSHVLHKIETNLGSARREACCELQFIYTNPLIYSVGGELCGLERKKSSVQIACLLCRYYLPNNLSTTLYLTVYVSKLGS